MNEPQSKKTIVPWHKLDESTFTIDDVRDNVDRSLFWDSLETILLTLTERERLVILHRFRDGLTFREIGKKLGLCGQRIKELESRSLRKIRHPTRRKCLKEFYVECYRSEKIWEEKNRIEYEQYKKERAEIEEKYKKEEEERRQKQRPLGAHVYTIQLVDIPLIRTPAPARKASLYCPSQVVLDHHPDGSPYLRVTNPWDNIDRNRDPETYDRWLTQRIEERNASTG